MKGTKHTTEVKPLAKRDLAVDHSLAALSQSLRFLLEVTPVDGDDVRREFLADDSMDDPTFTYREFDTDPEVASAQLAMIDVSAVNDRTLGHLLRAKHDELELEMLRARGTDDFLGLSIELYGGISPRLREQAEGVLDAVPASESAGESLDAEDFLALALAEIEHYREQDPDLEMHAEVRPDVSGVMVSGRTLLLGPESAVQVQRPRPCSPTRSAPTWSPRSTAAPSRCACWAPGSPAMTRPRRAWPSSPRSPAVA